MPEAPLFNVSDGMYLLDRLIWACWFSDLTFAELFDATGLPYLTTNGS